MEPTVSDVTFVTDLIPAVGDLPAIAAKEITAESKIRPKREGKWWMFDLPKDGIPVLVYVAPANKLNVEFTLAQAAVDLLISRRMETLAEREPDGRDREIF